MPCRHQMRPRAEKSVGVASLSLLICQDASAPLLFQRASQRALPIVHRVVLPIFQWVEKSLGVARAILALHCQAASLTLLLIRQEASAENLLSVLPTY